MAWSARNRHHRTPAMRLIALTLALLALALPAAARCMGSDLIEALAPADRAALEQVADAAPFARGNLFRATKGAQVIHLVGTYHLADPRHDALAARVDPLLADAAVLLVEAGPDEEARLKAEVQRRPEVMLITDGPTLPEQLPEAEWQAVAAEMRARGIPPVVASRFRPWYLAMMLGIPPCAMDAVRAGEKGLDHRLVAAAQARGVPVAALEPFDTLFSVFGDLPAQDELDMIRAAMLMADRPEDMTVTLANAYFAGQSRLLWEFTLSRSLSLPGFDPAEVRRQFALLEEVLMVRRNRAWVPVLTAAATRGPVVAAFGALHLPGADGIPALLAAEGWQIDRLDG
jgi:hypothetical protein